MSPVGSVNPSFSGLPLLRPDAPVPKLPGMAVPGGGLSAAPPGEGFSRMLDGLVATVGAKQAHAGELTRRVLLGESDQLHQSVIAMQEASVAFSLMVEVRNKLVESYQELMRMQV
jgi:flagellar hook-basal body complex protein FliE